jgi:hypothetical protein
MEEYSRGSYGQQMGRRAIGRRRIVLIKRLFTNPIVSCILS